VLKDKDIKGGKEEILTKLRKENIVAFPEEAEEVDYTKLSRIEQLKANSNAFAQIK